MVSRLIQLCVLVLVLLHGIARANTELAVHLDRERIGEDETVQVTLAYNGEADFEPDLSAFGRDFELLGQSRSHHTRIVNGRIGVRQILKLDLAPKRTGSLIIPAIQFDGVSSTERVLQVDAANTADPTTRTHFIEVDVTPREPWVQQQVVYRVRIYQRTPVIDGSLSEPVADGVTLERLGTDRSFRETRGGVEWDVHERRYALFPQRSGEVTLEAVRLLARVAADGNESGSFFNRQTRQIRVRGPAVTLSVKAAPADVGWWLPAAALNVTANWIDADTPRVGDPITLELVMTAHGTQAAQLPELVPTGSDSVKVYPGQSETGRRALASGFVSQRRVRHQVVATRDGELELDPVEFEWFSTLDGVVQREVVAIPALTIAPAVSLELPGFEAEAAAQAAAPEAEPAVETDAIAAESDAVVSAVDTAQQRLFAWLRAQRHLVPLALWLLPFVVAVALMVFLARTLWRARQRGPRAALRTLASAMRSGDRDRSQHALLWWASEIWAVPPQSLPAIAERLSTDSATEDLSRRIRQLDRALHHGVAADWQDPGLARALRRIAVQPRTARERSPALPSLGAAWATADSIAGKKSA